MKRDEFVGDNKIERFKDPEIKPKQRWKAVEKHDFGNGPVTYYITVAFKDPMSKLWICNYSWDGANFMANQSSNYVAKLTTEEITKNFEISEVVVQQIPINPTIWPQYIPANPDPGQIIYRDGTGDPAPFYNYTFTVADTANAMSAVVNEHTHAFNFANNMVPFGK